MDHDVRQDHKRQPNAAGGASGGAKAAGLTKVDARRAWVVVGLGFSASILCIVLSPEGLVQFDDLTHYLYAKWAWRWPEYLLDGWGRPGFTALFFLPALWGWVACRLFSAGLTAATAWLTYQLAARMGLRHAWGAALLFFVQPLVFQLSQTTLTETPLAFYLALALYWAQRDRWALSSAALSLGLVTRHEAVVLALVWVCFAWRRGSRLNWRLLVLLLWAPLVVNVLSALSGGNTLLSLLFEPVPSNRYGHGGWLTFFCRSMEAFGPGVMILGIIGLASLARLRPGGGMIAACAVVYFAAQTVVRALGLYDSGGYARFLVPIAPCVALAALAGWQKLWTDDRRALLTTVLVSAAAMTLLWASMERQLQLYAHGLDEAANLPQLTQAKIAVRVATASLILLAIMTWRLTRSSRQFFRYGRVLMPAGIAGLILLAVYALCGPLPRPPEAVIIDELRTELAERGLGDRPILCACVWMEYAQGNDVPLHRPRLLERLKQAAPGTLFAWERQFAGHAEGVSLKQLEQDVTYRSLMQARPRPWVTEPYLIVFEKVVPPVAGPSARD